MSLNLPIGTPVLVKKRCYAREQKFTILGWIIAYIPKGEKPSNIYPDCNNLAYYQLHNKPVPEDRYLVEYRWNPRARLLFDYDALKPEWVQETTNEEVLKRGWGILQYE